MNLHLHVKTCYFDQIKAGTKTEEYRLANPYWEKRLWQRNYDKVIIYNAYKPGAENKMQFPYSGWRMETRLHNHFGPYPVTVFAIPLKKDSK